MSDKPTRPTAAAAAGASEEESKGMWAGYEGAGQGCGSSLAWAPRPLVT